MLKTASRRCRWSGSAARALAVASPTDGVATISFSSSGQVQCNASGACPSSAITEIRPPKSAGAALSACPSIEEAAASSSRSDSGCATFSKIRRPATVAAALLPSPAAIGIPLSTSTCTVGVLMPVRSAMRWNARSSALCPFTGGELRATTSRVPPSSRTSTIRARRYICTATPRVSNPPPRFATEPGTVTSPGRTAPAALPRAVFPTAEPEVVLSDTKQKRYHGFPPTPFTLDPVAKAPFSIGIIQDRADQDAAANLARGTRLIREAAARGAQIICLKELFNAPYFCKAQHADRFDLAEPIPGPTTDALQKLARELAVVLVVPLFERQGPGVYRNSAAVIDADGSLMGVYRKMHIPDDPLFYEKYYFTPGDGGFMVWKTRYATIGVLICWDQWFPEAARITALMG